MIDKSRREAAHLQERVTVTMTRLQLEDMAVASAAFAKLVRDSETLEVFRDEVPVKAVFEAVSELWWQLGDFMKHMLARAEAAATEDIE